MKRTKKTFISIVDWIEKNIREDICVDDIVIKSGYSKRNVQYIFKKYLGYGIYGYLKKRRLSLAAKLLKMTRMPIIEISSIYHFSSCQSFCRAFTATFGIPPAKYRRTTNWILNNYTGNAALERPEITSNLIELPQMDVDITEKEFKIAFPSGVYNNKVNESNTPEIKSYILSLVLDNLDKESLMLAYGVEVCKQSNVTLRVKVKLIEQKKKEASFQRQILDGGLYYQFHYEGKWDEYCKFSDYIYLNELPELKVNKRRTLDLEIFDIMAFKKKGIIVVDFFVPVTPATLLQSRDNLSGSETKVSFKSFNKI
ncbi:helix-turn-helix domain-containing protein [Salmonella enterica subsp. enterica]|nr:hypothetical protein [Salmonella enterica subsp. enterica serovar Newport]EAM8557765.1 helix-turn-helix domain-containing protein [Salmonella enterica]EBK6376441.1 helix-turn-helix domain-containing protein [Salmonella enterica subsp. enterica serovar Stanley]EBM9870340.1 helix-turn-helix domain-containing protein [Salmonella enterica subsp. enterica serovar Senftenberg]EBY9723129.1 helix-turn-helix domain-containing protein [Salmonella enterica subsp. enterica serovar Chester]ECE0392118.1 